MKWKRESSICRCFTRLNWKRESSDFPLFLFLSPFARERFFPDDFQSTWLLLCFVSHQSIISTLDFSCFDFLRSVLSYSWQIPIRYLWFYLHYLSGHKHDHLCVHNRTNTWHWNCTITIIVIIIVSFCKSPLKEHVKVCLVYSKYIVVFSACLKTFPLLLPFRFHSPLLIECWHNKLTVLLSPDHRHRAFCIFGTPLTTIWWLLPYCLCTTVAHSVYRFSGSG